MGLFDSFVESGLKAYDYLHDRKKLPANKRIFLETFLDKSSSPISEKDLSDQEKQALIGLIKNKYEKPEFKQSVIGYKQYLEQRLQSQEENKKKGNKDKLVYPGVEESWRKDLQAIKSFEAGQLTPDFLKLAAGSHSSEQRNNILDAEARVKGVNIKAFNIPSNIQYEDYPGIQNDARNVLSGSNPLHSLATLLGRFNYGVDQKGNLFVKDKYDFNAPSSPITGISQAPQNVSESSVTGAAETGGTGIYGLLREYAGANLPPESRGRPVYINLSNTGLEPTIK